MNESKQFDTLYSRDSKGKIKEWMIFVRNDEMYSTILISYGLLKGKKQIDTDIIEVGKNIGKKNQTSHYEQAILEAHSRFDHKKLEGYKSVDTLIGMFKLNKDDAISKPTIEAFLEEYLPLNNSDSNGDIKPMKCTNYYKDNGTPRQNFPVFAQPKLNGFRCVAKLKEVIIDKGTLLERTEQKVIFTSKMGLEYTILEHIESEFKIDDFQYFKNAKSINLVLDGEMYIPGLSLQEISSAVRKRNSNTSKLQFHIFDVAIDNMNQSSRIEILDILRLVFNTTHKTNFIKIVPTVIVFDDIQAQAFCDKSIKEGYEGAVFRDMKALYSFGGRPSTITKLKRFMDKEYIIKDVVGGDSSPELGIFVCETENNKQFKVTPEGSYEIKKEYLTNKINYIGKLLTIKFYEYTKDNIPFHCTGIAVRDYEI